MGDLAAPGAAGLALEIHTVTLPSPTCCCGVEVSISSRTDPSSEDKNVLFKKQKGQDTVGSSGLLDVVTTRRHISYPLLCSKAYSQGAKS